jgi:hypothetical protein
MKATFPEPQWSRLHLVLRTDPHGFAHRPRSSAADGTGPRCSCHAALQLLGIVVCCSSGFHSVSAQTIGPVHTMMNVNESQLELTIMDPYQQPENRLEALEKYANAYNTSTDDLLSKLSVMLRRLSPDYRKMKVDWDPQAAERQVDLKMVAIIYQRGHDVQRRNIAVFDLGRGKDYLLEIIENPGYELPSRLNALKDLKTNLDSALLPRLIKSLDRNKPIHTVIPNNWDLDGAERVVDLHIIGLLHLLGDDSQLARVITCIRQATRIHDEQPDFEFAHASQVILDIGKPELIGETIKLFNSNSINALKVLIRIGLPQAATHGDVAGLFPKSETYTFTSSRLKQELEKIVRLSKRRIRLSPGVGEYIKKKDYDTGKVKHERMALPGFIMQDLEILGFDYYLDGKKVVICTYEEAGIHWQKWWSEVGDRLVFNKEKGRFDLRQ